MDGIDGDRRSPKIVGQVNAVGQQTADFSEGTVGIDGREAVASRKRCDLQAIGDREAIRHRDKAAIRLASLCGKDRIEVRGFVNRC